MEDLRTLPDDQNLINEINKDQNRARMAGYGAEMIDEIIEQENLMFTLVQKISGHLMNIPINIGGMK